MEAIGLELKVLGPAPLCLGVMNDHPLVCMDIPLTGILFFMEIQSLSWSSEWLGHQGSGNDPCSGTGTWSQAPTLPFAPM